MSILAFFRLYLLIFSLIFFPSKELILNEFNWAKEVEKIEVNYQARVNLLGKTNINTFACYSPRVSDAIEVKLFRLGQKGQIEFEHPTMEVSVFDLDCGGRGINRDMQNTLHAEEYPKIKIRVQSAQLKSAIKSPPSRDPEEVMALTCISISGVERCLDIPVVVNYLSPIQMQICGSLPIAMTEFGLEPPKALMGMIQANDNITVSFDMNIELNKKK